MYNNQITVQQNGGTSPSRQEACCVVPRDTILLSKNETSIIRKFRCSKPNETSIRPSFSVNTHKPSNNENRSTVCDLPRSSSIQRIISPRVRFHENVHVVAIDSVDDIPHEIRQNLWMSRDELSFCMHEAMIAKQQEESILEKQQLLEEGEEADQFKEGKAERRNSNTSVTDDVDDDNESFYESLQESIKNYNESSLDIHPVAAPSVLKM